MSDALLEELVRPDILSLRAYVSARSLVANGDGLRFLDANEAPAPFNCGGSPLHRYPSQQPERLTQRLSGYLGVRPEQLLVTRGSDEAIDIMVRALCGAGLDAIGICPPTYGMYRVAADLQGAETLSAPLTASFGYDLSALERLLSSFARPGASPRLKVLFLCSPANPTGTGYPVSVIETVLRLAEGRCFVVVDEAYAEYATEQSALTLLERHPHLVVLRTLSKAWALAGARVGMLVGAEPLVALLRKVLAPYPLALPAVDAALAATTPDALDAMGRRVAATVAERHFLAAQLDAVSPRISVAPSQTNFLLVRCPSDDIAGRVMAAARRRDILLRDRSREHGLGGCIRVTVGTTRDTEDTVASFAEGLA